MELKKNQPGRSASSKCFGCSAKHAFQQTSGSSGSRVKGKKATITGSKSSANHKITDEAVNSPVAACTCIQPPAPKPLDKESVVLRSIVADNSKYFIDKSKVCCSVKPSDERLHLPTTTGHTMYMQDFSKKLPSDASVKINRMEPYRANYPFMDLTNYRVNYVEHPFGPSKPIDHQSQKDEDAPRFLQTQYKGDFKNWGGRSTNFKIEPQQNNVLGGGAFDGKTMYRSEFGPKSSTASNFVNGAQSSTSPLFLDMNMPVTSNYRNEFTPKSGSLEKNCKPKHLYVPSIGNQSTFNTEYKKMFDPKEHDHCHYRKVMSVKELQDLVSRK